MTIPTCRSARRSSSGFAAVTIRSAHLPGATVPVSLPMPASSALRVLEYLDGFPVIYDSALRLVAV